MPPLFWNSEVHYRSQEATTATHRYSHEFTRHPRITLLYCPSVYIVSGIS